MEQNAKMLLADVLNGVGMLIDADPHYVDLLAGDDTALLDAAVIGTDQYGRVQLKGTRIASGLEHEVYDAVRLDELDKKWNVDAVALLKELRSMKSCERRAIILDIAAAWEDSQSAQFNQNVANAGHDAKKPERVDGFLSRKMQTVRPGALVYEQSDGTWCVRGGGPELKLGKTFHDAVQAVNAMRNANNKRT